VLDEVEIAGRDAEALREGGLAQAEAHAERTDSSAEKERLAHGITSTKRGSEPRRGGIFTGFTNQQTKRNIIVTH
jgi:hypothetical protein